MIGVVEHGYLDDEQSTHHEVNLVFETEIVGEPVSQEAHLEFMWLPADRIAVTDLRPMPVKEIIEQELRSVWRGWSGSG